MDGTSVKQPYVCATKLLVGSYPDIVEPYPYGPNVTIIVSSPNVSYVIPDKCCTAVIPGVEVEVNTVPAVTRVKGQENTVVVPIVTGPVPYPTPPTKININETLVNLYRFICNEGTCAAHHFYSIAEKASLECCHVQGYSNKIVRDSDFTKVQRRCPRLRPLNAFFTKDKSGMFVLTTDTSKIEFYENNDDYLKFGKLGYCSPKQHYCGATLALYEIQINYKHKKDNFYTTSDEEIDFFVNSKKGYNGPSTKIVCWTWPNSALVKGPKDETVIDEDCSGIKTTLKNPITNPDVVEPVTYPEGPGIVTEPPSVVCAEDTCGRNADCSVSDEKIVCTCDPYDHVKGCEIPMTCAERSCGPNALCFVRNNANFCECKLGYGGNPFDLKDGCRVMVVTASTWGDPHYVTYDGLKYDWHGTCPHIFSMNCRPGDIAPYEDFKIKARNSNFWFQRKGLNENKQLEGYSEYARIVEIEVEFPNLVIHIAEDYKLYINNRPENFDYYYPSITDQRISVSKAQYEVTIKRYDNLEIKFIPYFAKLAVTIPDVPALHGVDKLCGMGGNRDRKGETDLRLRDGTIVDVKSSQKFGDSWVIARTDFMNTIEPEMEKCSAHVPSSHVCENNHLGSAMDICKPIQDAKRNQGPFAGCQALGIRLDGYYEACAFDVCTKTVTKCTAFATFVSQCQDQVPYAKIDNWRKETKCDQEIQCPANSHYSPCATSCPASCQKCHEKNGVQICWGLGARVQKCEYQTKKVCLGGECRWQNEKVCPPAPKDACIDHCVEGCECNAGFMVDKKHSFQCIQQCPAGSYMPISCERSAIANSPHPTRKCIHGGTWKPAEEKCFVILKKPGSDTQHKDTCKCFHGDLISRSSDEAKCNYPAYPDPCFTKLLGGRYRFALVSRHDLIGAEPLIKNNVASVDACAEAVFRNHKATGLEYNFVNKQCTGFRFVTGAPTKTEKSSQDSSFYILTDDVSSISCLGEDESLRAIAKQVYSINGAPQDCPNGFVASSNEGLCELNMNTDPPARPIVKRGACRSYEAPWLVAFDAGMRKCLVLNFQNVNLLLSRSCDKPTRYAKSLANEAIHSKQVFGGQVYCYFAFPKPKWTDDNTFNTIATNWCNVEWPGSGPVKLLNKVEMIWVFDSFNADTNFGNPNAAESGLIIGLKIPQGRNQAMKDQWVWYDNTPVNMDFWGPGFPAARYPKQRLGSIWFKDAYKDPFWQNAFGEGWGPLVCKKPAI